MKRFYLMLIMMTTLSVFDAMHSEADDKGITEIRMQRFGCPPATCPTDNLILRNYGGAYYIGEKAVQPLGVSRGSIEPFKFKALTDFLESQDFFSQKDTPPIGVGMIDGVTISVVRNGKTHRLRIRNVTNPPSTLWGIMMSIRGLAADIEWIKHEGGVRGTITNISQQLEPVSPDNSPPYKYFINVKRPDEEYPAFRNAVSEKGVFEIILPPGEYSLSVEQVVNSRRHFVGEAIKFVVPEIGFVEVKPELGLK